LIITPILDNGTAGLMVVSVLLFLINTIMNWKINSKYKSVIKIQEKILSEVRDIHAKADKIGDSVKELKVTSTSVLDHSKNNQVMIDSLFIPFIDELRENNKNFYQLLNSIGSNITNLIANTNSVFQGLIMTLKNK
jgi:predicted PurR-regulated permease PerM